MNTKKGHSDFTGLKRSAFPVPEKRDALLDRLKASIRAAGGNNAVALRAGVPIGTLNNFVRGTETRLSAAHRIAVACGVSLDWLMTGEGPKSGSDIESGCEKPQIQASVSQPSEAEPVPSPSLDHDRLNQAIQIVDALGELRGPDAAAKIIAAYDILTSRKP